MDGETKTVELAQLKALLDKPCITLSILPDGRFDLHMEGPLTPMGMLKLIVGAVEDIRYQVYDQTKKSPLAL